MLRRQLDSLDEGERRRALDAMMAAAMPGKWPVSPPTGG
jgi:hypothetical protein